MVSTSLCDDTAQPTSSKNNAEETEAFDDGRIVDDGK